MTGIILNRAARFFALATLAALGLSLPANAATFSAQRGVNMDIWTTWPGRDKWGDASVMLPFPEWRQHVSEEKLTALKADGFDFIRMPVDPAPLLSAEGAPLKDRLLADVLDTARLANRAGLKVIVDLHLIGGDVPGTMGSVMSSPAEFDRYAALVQEMAGLLSKEDPSMVALELMNEPVVDCEPGEDSWPKRLKFLSAAARAAAPHLTLILTGACWSNADKLAAIDPTAIADDNVIWTFHSYEPFLLTHQGASWAGDFIPYVTGLPYPPSSVPRPELDAALDAIRARMRKEAPLMRRAGLLAYLDEQIAEIDTDAKLKAVMDGPFDTVAAWADRYDIPRQNILLGEFGMITQDYGKPYVMPVQWRAAYSRDVIARAEARGFAWSIWSYGGSFGLVDAFDGKKADPTVLNLIRELPARMRPTITD